MDGSDNSGMMMANAVLAELQHQRNAALNAAADARARAAVAEAKLAEALKELMALKARPEPGP